ncbi:hypothetical protein V6N12_029058 [Hibiscus sabdariffa]|uniref:RNase H type-1 domain-containing protein n=1 Tax=Hibiscus sabdariffa TaxID=183260 RepID=A0ABR2F7M9_9ROSI
MLVINSFVSQWIKDVITLVRSYGYEFKALSCNLAHLNPVTMHHWLPPTSSWSKINTDVSFLSSSTPAYTGVVIRDDHGFILGSCYRVLQHSPSAFMSEAIAILHGLQFAIDLGLRQVF